MAKKKKNNFDDMYAEDLVWMSYRYAIGYLTVNIF